MPQGAERMDDLRDTIARIEGGLAARFGASAPRRVALGRDLPLDRLLGGGLRRGGLHEVVAARPGDAGAACGFALALAARFAAEAAGPVVWILEDAARAETGIPYAPGLAAHGLDPGRLLLVRTRDAAGALWAMEEALKCRTAAVVLDLWRTKAYDLVASRRLVLAAGRSGTPGLMVPAGGAGTAHALSTAAQTRFEIAAAPGPALPALGDRVPLPGRAAWAVRLARIRAGPSGAADFDRDLFWPLVWNHEEAWFCDALPLPPPALPRDRPHPPAAAGRGRASARADASVAADTSAATGGYAA